jgi:acetolactate synthase-1/2/3 large subunit
VDRPAAREVLALLARAERPLIIAGSGAGYAKAGPALQAFIEKTGIPAATMAVGRGIVSDEHPLVLGQGHPGRNAVVAAAAKQADILLYLGHRISLNEAFGASLNSEACLIQVDICGEELGRNRKVQVPVVSDARAFMEELNDLLKGGLPAVFADKQAWRDFLAEERKRKEEARRPFVTSEALPINPYRLAYEVDAYLDRPDDIIIADGGDTSTWVHMARIVRKPYRLLEHGPFGAIGQGICNTVTARLLYPDSRLALVTGDGSMGFNFMEINTAMRYGMHFVIVVCNDQSWGMIRHTQQLRFGRSFDEVAWLGATPYHKMIESMGGVGFLVERPSDIKSALGEAFASRKIACINVLADPEVISPGSTGLATVGAYAS